MAQTAASESTSRRKWIEISAVIILAIASLITAWSTYQASQWTRVQSATGNQVIASLLESARLTTLGSQDSMVDLMTFTSWLDAYASDNDVLADFYRDRLRVEFKPAFEAWLATEPSVNPDAPPSPFAMPEYQPAHVAEAAVAQARAGTLQELVRAAADNASFYIRNTIFMASALFFVGISRMFPEGRIRVAMITMALAFLILGMLNILGGRVA